METKTKRTPTMKQDKCFQILKMMTEKLHTSLGAVSANVFKLCALLAVPPVHLETIQRNSTPVTRHSVSHEVLDLFQWSTTIEQELAHLIATLAAARQTNGTWPLERKLSKRPSSSTVPVCNGECLKRNSIPDAVPTAWLDDLDHCATRSLPTSSRHPHPHNHPHHVIHPHHHPHHPLFHLPQHQYHFPHHHHHSPNHSPSHSPSSLSPDQSPRPQSPSQSSSSSSNTTSHPKISPRTRSESAPAKRITERLTERLSFRRKRTSPTVDVSSPPAKEPQSLHSSFATSCTLTDSCTDESEQISSAVPSSTYVTSDDNSTPPTTPTGAHGFTSDDESSIPPAHFTPTMRRRSAPLCFDSQTMTQELSKDKEKGKQVTWKLFSKSTGNSTDDEVAVSKERRVSKKSKFRLRLFASADASEVQSQ